MPLTIIRSSPDASAYTLLSTFQSETPDSFNTPVLHYHLSDARVLISADQASLIPIFGASPSDSPEETTVEGIDLWVTNENLIFFNKPLSVGAIIPYLSLTLHAVQRVASETGLYMQISLTPDISTTTNRDEHDEEELIELTLIPAVSSEISQSDVANAVFKALTLCTSLHSAASNSEDEDDDGEDRILFEGAEDDDTPRLQGFPGEGGWITAENVDQFRFDDAEDGSTTILGPGAGNVRRREHEDEEETVNVADDDSKWRRTA